MKLNLRDSDGHFSSSNSGGKIGVGNSSGRMPGLFFEQIRNFILPVLLLVLWNSGLAQTNPTAQSLPYSQNFGTTTFTSMPAGMAAWTAGGNKTTQAAAESGTPAADAAITAATATTTTGSVYGYASGGNARVYIQQSSNATNGNSTIAVAINTGTATSITVAYQLELINGGVTTQDYGHELQYRLGTTGGWTNVTGSAMTFGAVTSYTPQTLSYTISGLTASSVYQIRWITWRPAGSGNSKGIGIDNIAIASAAVPTITATGTLSAVNTIYGSASNPPTSFTVSGANMTAGILVTPPAGYEVCLTSGGTYTGTVTVGSSGTIASTSVFVRLKSTATVAGSPYSGNIVCSSSGATSKNIATVSSTVSQKQLTISGITANSKVFDGNTSATLSGTAALVGVEPTDSANVSLGGTPVATFASSAVGTAITVNVTGYSISGSASGNYVLTQPTLSADITSSPSPTINSALTASATYGLAATIYTITASDAPTSFNASGLPSGLTINTGNGEISGTPTAAVGSYNVTIAATNAGGTGNAILVYTINPKPLTVSGATANNKVYDRTNAATISGSVLSGIFGADLVNISNTGTFASASVNNAIAVTSTQTLSGANAGNYVLTIPTGLNANITPKALTIAGAAAQSKAFDGNTTATITGTLSGVIAPDAVTLALSGNFASSAVGSNIAVTSTATISGADAGNYTLTQPTGLSASIIAGPTTLAAGDLAIIGYNTSGSPDNFAVLVLKDLNGGTVFYVNDNEVATAGGTSFADLGEVEASFTVKAGQTIPAGTVLILPWGQGAVSTTTYDWSTTSGAGLGNNNEEIYIYTAPSIVATTPTAFIYYAKIGSSVSAVPAGLTSGFTAISPNGAALRYLTSGALYVGCPTALLNAIALTASNWNTAGATAIAAADWSFTVESTCRTIVASGSLAALSTTYGTPSSETSFDVSGTNLLSAITVTAPAGFEVSLTSGGTFTPSVTVGAAGTVPTTTVYVRLSGSATVAGSPYAGNVVCTSTGAPTVNVPASGTVAPLTITTTGAIAANKSYDRTTDAIISGATAVGTVISDGITISGGGTFDTANVGTAKPVTAALTLSGSNVSSYLLIQPTGLTANINAALLTISGAAASNKIYDANSSATLLGSLTGVIAPDNVTLVKSAGFATATVGTAKPVTSTSFITGADIANYTLVQPTGLTADITARPLTIADATAQNKVFDGNNTAIITGTLAGVIAPDDVVLSLSGTFNDASVGLGKPVTSTSTISGGDASNYTLTQPLGLTANISAAALLPQTITFNPLANVIYGNTVTLAATASSGLTVSYESLNTAIATISGNILTTVGTGTVTIKATQSGNSTYDSAPFVTQTLTVTPKELTATATADNKVYDGNDIATISGTLNGIVGSDVVNFDGTGTFVTVTVGTGIEVLSTATISGANSANYTLAPLTGLSADITTKALTVAPGSATADNKVYDTTTSANITGGDLVGVVGADEVYILDTFGTFDTANVGNGKPITTALTIDGANAFNYSLIQPTGLTANITAASLTISGISGINKVYNGNTTGSITGTPVLSGVLGADDVSVSGTATATFATKTVGVAKPLTITGYTLSGAQASNYSFSQPVGITANITAASLQIIGAVAQNKAFDGTTAALLTGTLSAAIGADVVTLIGTGTFATSAIGNGIAVTSTATLGGADGGNYIINPQPSGLTANITAGLQFTPGRLVVARVGLTGQATAPSSAATAIFLDEYTTAGTAGISVALPTTTNATINRVLESGSATSEAQLNLSGNGQYLVLGGYDAVPGSASASAAGNPRVIARVNNFGTVATLPIGATHTSGFRSAASFDGTRFWTAGNGNGVTTVPFTTSTTTAAAPVTIYNGATNLRTVSIFNNQLYVSTGSGTNGVYKVGTGLPATAGQTATNIAALADVYAYSMVNRGGNNWNLYAVVGNAVALNQGIYKYSSTDNGATWTANGSIKPTTAPVFGVTAMVNGGSVDIYATTTTSILKVTDSVAFNAPLTGTPSVFVTAPANTFFRGIAFAPVEPVTSAVLAGNATVCENTATNLNVTITGGASPYTVVYNDGISNITINNYVSGTNIPVTPAATQTYTLVSVRDAYGNLGTGVTGTAVVTVNPIVTYYRDADGDTYGNPLVTTTSCTGAPAGYVANSLDCDDTNAALNPTNPCTPAGLALNVKMFVQGYYVGGGLMNSVRLNQDFVSDANNVEMMTVELHDASTYALVASTTAMLHTDGTLSASFASAAAGSYYIAIKGSNIIQTWSAAPYSVSSTASTYDFTTGASQAYGDNMVDVGSGVYAMYSGDITHDDSIDLSDYSAWETDFNAFAFGEFITDLNGDGSVDLIDYSIWEGNFNNFIFAFYPN